MLKNRVFVHSLVALLLYMIGFISSYPYLLNFNHAQFSLLDTLRNLIEYSLMFLSFLLFCILFLRKNIFLKVLGYVFILILSLNFMLSASCFFIYKEGFNVGMMISILETNPSESFSMMKTLIKPLIATLFFFFILVSIINTKNIDLKQNFEWKSTVYKEMIYSFSFIWLLLPLFFYLKHQYISNKGGGVMVKNVVYHLMDVYRAYDLKKELEDIKNKKVNYQLIKREEQPIENIVILLGESARRVNMSLYGYNKPTTPIIDKEKKNLLLFKNAYAPAGITNLAIPLILSNVDIQNYKRDLKQLSDNALNVANYLGYQTHWYSTQGGGQGISAIASFAKNKKWISGYDEKVLPLLRESLKGKSKKIIVLHINGSHPYVCDKYPESETVWNGGLDECYDNSIRYTDKIMGQIIDEIKDENAALIYVSDHGQKRENGQYYHGDFREASEVPFFIWYSPSTYSTKKGKVVDELISTTELYPKALELMGVENPNKKDNSGKYLKSDLSAIEYKNLK